MELSTVRFLLSPPGRELIAQVQAAWGADDELAIAANFRRRYPADQVAGALTQVALRHQAAIKFGADAELLHLTPDGLEQATHHIVAEHRARRIAQATSDVVDLCCGVGADLIALARAGLSVVGVDRDPVAVELARANLAALDLAGGVEVGDAASYPRPNVGVIYADPARRGPAGRVFDPSRYSPPWPVIEQLLTEDAAVKLAPGIDHALIPAAVEAEWVSLDGQLREAVLWSGALAAYARRATVLRSTGRSAQLSDLDEPDEAVVGGVGTYVLEPDDAVIRAHLVTAFAEQVNGWLIDEHLAYVSTDQPSDTDLGRCYRVIEVLPFKQKALRAALQARDVGPLTIKKRGVDITPEILRKRLKLRGTQPATVMLTRTPKSALALLVEPLPRSG